MENKLKLGFGLMRLPKFEDGTIDVEQVKIMVDRFIEAGGTYFDTAYMYPGSEEAMKKALIERYPRETYTVASKLMCSPDITSEEMAKKETEISLERSGAGYFDYYLLHNIGAPRIKAFDDFGIWDFLKERKAEGLIRHLGFSFHDSPEMLDRVLTEHPDMDFVQLQINYADWEDPGIRSGGCWEVARKHGKPVVIMEPVKGGMLASLPEAAAAPLRKAAPEKSLASWALRFAAGLDGLVTVLSGMSNTEQMKENLALMRDLPAFTEAEKAALAETQKYIASIPQVPCTGCSYCTKGCPQSIPIPDIFTAWNQYKVYENLTPAKRFYGFVTRGGQKASTCVECGQCESVCPQSIGIIEELKQVSAAFDD